MGTIKVDTITPLATNSEVTIASNKFVGTAAGTMTVVGEGGTTQTNLQQGLLKSWIQFNGTGTIGTQDSYNRSGLTDNGTGDYTLTFTNNMSNDDYHVGLGTNSAENEISALATSTVRVLALNSSGSSNDKSIITLGVHGDLA